MIDDFGVIMFVSFGLLLQCCCYDVKGENNKPLVWGMLRASISIHTRYYLYFLHTLFTWAIIHPELCHWLSPFVFKFKKDLHIPLFSVLLHINHYIMQLNYLPSQAWHSSLCVFKCTHTDPKSIPMRISIQKLSNNLNS